MALCFRDKMTELDFGSLGLLTGLQVP
jgi:hypothetical protein